MFLLHSVYIVAAATCSATNPASCGTAFIGTIGKWFSALIPIAITYHAVKKFPESQSHFHLILEAAVGWIGWLFIAGMMGI
ncbi:MAG: hypothetical protein ACYCZN_02090 [Candidatus Dormibacteria bacterium]